VSATLLLAPAYLPLPRAAFPRLLRTVIERFLLLECTASFSVVVNVFGVNFVFVILSFGLSSLLFGTIYFFIR